MQEWNLYVIYTVFSNKRSPFGKSTITILGLIQEMTE